MSQQFEIKNDGKTSTLRLIGAVDVSTATALQTALLECVSGASLESVQIDCSGVTHLDVAAAQLILAALRLPDIDIRVKLPDEPGVRDWLASGGIDSLLVASDAGAIA
ncbi:MAG: STAS domain-containing protein [Pirellulaceae bacterium]